MTIQTTRYIRKPLYVEAIQIDESNFISLAEWCQGEIRTNGGDFLVDNRDKVDPKTQHIRLRVHNPKSIRQMQGHVGDWILYTDRGYKIYTQKAFKACFDQASNGEVETTS